MMQKGIEHHTNTVIVQVVLICEIGWEKVQTSAFLSLSLALGYVLLDDDTVCTTSLCSCESCRCSPRWPPPYSPAGTVSRVGEAPALNPLLWQSSTSALFLCSFPTPQTKKPPHIYGQKKKKKLLIKVFFPSFFQPLCLIPIYFSTQNERHQDRAPLLLCSDVAAKSISRFYMALITLVT